MVGLLVGYLVGWSVATSGVDPRRPILFSPSFKTLRLLSLPVRAGNIRQLQNILFRAIALNETGIIEKSDIDGALSQFSTSGLTISSNIEEYVSETENNITHNEWSDWSTAQDEFESNLLKELYPLYPTTRKLAERLKVSHNKIAMKLRKYRIS